MYNSIIADDEKLASWFRFMMNWCYSKDDIFLWRDVDYQQDEEKYGMIFVYAVWWLSTNMSNWNMPDRQINIGKYHSEAIYATKLEENSIKILI